jgi:hypothetical protein
VPRGAGKASRHDVASSRRHSDVTDVIDDDTQFFASLRHPILQKEISPQLDPSPEQTYQLLSNSIHLPSADKPPCIP